MAPLTKQNSEGRRRLGRGHLALLGVAVLVGAGVAIAVSSGPATPAAPEPAVAAAPSTSTPVAVEPPQPAPVDAELVHSVARQALIEQDQAVDLTDVDLIARDVLAQGPLEEGDVHRVTNDTLLGFGPGGPVDAQIPPHPECAPTARACIDVDGKRAWMQSDGRITYGPVPVTTGMSGYETTRGTHQVLRHVRDDHSRIFDSPMPYSTYFTTSGIAFHEGRLDEPSHGCIHLGHHAAVHFFDQLQVGDQVVAF
ncbi:MAG: L,D-transpeptidase [Corynebacterium sp.]|nr:L,D-transpeptidase [Corynebacterium sp.]